MKCMSTQSIYLRLYKNLHNTVAFENIHSRCSQYLLHVLNYIRQGPIPPLADKTTDPLTIYRQVRLRLHLSCLHKSTNAYPYLV